MRRIVISSKGRVTIPSELRKKLGLNPGTHVNWSKDNEKLVLTPVARLRSRGSGDLSRRRPTTNGRRRFSRPHRLLPAQRQKILRPLDRLRHLPQQLL
jgi:AbrB family looped-hinge helix DNA binding protein